MRKLYLATALTIGGALPVIAQCPERSSIRWSLLPAQNSAQPIFVSMTSNRSIYRLLSTRMCIPSADAKRPGLRLLRSRGQDRVRDERSRA